MGPRSALAAVLLVTVAAACCALGLPRHAKALPTLATPLDYPAQEASDPAWLAAGLLPGLGTRWEAMSRTSLRDLHHLTPAPPVFGGPTAGAGKAWGYTWPRDAAFSAAAMARTGHASEALLVLEFLQDVQYSSGGFAARYQLNGQAPLDPRQAQTDGSGWALWAMDAVTRSATGPGQRLVLDRYRQLLDRSTEFAENQTKTSSGLPSPSPDYWERHEYDLTLGTAAPLLAGLQAAARMYGVLGEDRQASSAAAAAARLEGAIRQHFGPGGYQRYGDHGGVDAAVCFLAPPFVQFGASAEVSTAIRTYQRTARRAAGGLAPGAGWRADGISWTPETALVALTAASTGDRETAQTWLAWLDQHRVSWGSLPEKVRPDGAPAGPAPLAWTSALAVLTVATLSPSPTVPPPLTDDSIAASIRDIDALHVGTEQG